MSRQIHLLPDAFESIFETTKPEEGMQQSFAHYATNRGYACAALLFQDLGMQFGPPADLVSTLELEDPDQREALIQSYWRRNNCYDWLNPRRVIHESSPGKPVGLLTLTSSVSTPLGELRRGGLLMVCEERDGFPWTGLQKWFLSDQSTLLFKCTSSFRKKESCKRTGYIKVGPLELHRGDMAVLYIPPSEASNGMTLKEWISTPEFRRAMASRVISGGINGCTIGYFITDYRDMCMQPEFVIRETLDAGIGPEMTGFVVGFRAILSEAWRLWTELHPGSVKSEAAAHDRVVFDSHKTLRYRVPSAQMTRSVLIIQRVWKKRFYHPNRYGQKLGDMIKQIQSDWKDNIA